MVWFPPLCLAFGVLVLANSFFWVPLLLYDGLVLTSDCKAPLTDSGALFQLSEAEMFARKSRFCCVDVFVWMTEGNQVMLSRNLASLCPMGLIRRRY